MSNHLAIATVTAALKETIRAAIAVDGTFQGFTIRTERPQNPPPAPAGPGVFVFLYQAMPASKQPSTDLRTRRSDGSVVQRPAVALNLYYLLSFFGNENKFEPQRAFAIVARTFHAQPSVTKKAIRDAVSANTDLTKSDLENAVEKVRLSPISLSLEDLSKLWSVMLQAPYLLSIAYEAAAVIIEEPVTPSPSLPVTTANTYTLPFLDPAIDELINPAGFAAPILAGSIIVLKGSNLRGPITCIRVGAAEAEATQVSGEQAAVPLGEPPFPIGSLRAGVQTVRVIHYQELGEERRRLSVGESNAVPVVLRPSFLSAPSVNGSRQLVLDVQPYIGESQSVSVQLMPVSGGRSSHLDVGARTTSVSRLTIPLTGIAAGTYFVKLSVDGADSLLETGADGAFAGPQVVAP
jgi:hypothetical protein